MRVEAIPYGPLGANLYVVEHLERYLLIDPCVRPSKCPVDVPLDRIDAIVITHGHFDHIIFADSWLDAVKEVCSKAPGLYIHSLDMPCLDDPELNLSAEFGYDIRVAAATRDIDELNGKTFPFDSGDGAEISIIHTPGHSRGEVCIGLKTPDEHLLFTGDMLFAGSVGRHDFVTSDPSDMMASVEILKKLPDNIKVYPGHGPSTTIALEKQYNPFFAL